MRSCFFLGSYQASCPPRSRGQLSVDRALVLRRVDGQQVEQLLDIPPDVDPEAEEKSREDGEVDGDEDVDKEREESPEHKGQAKDDDCEHVLEIGEYIGLETVTVLNVPTDPFTIIEPQDQEIGKFYVVIPC